MSDTRINAKDPRKSSGGLDPPTISRNNVQKFDDTIAKDWGVW